MIKGSAFGRLAITLICFLVHLHSNSQTITPSVINSGGKTTTVNLNSQPVIYTDNIGEAVIVTGSNSNNKLTQGFLQPDLVVISNVSVSVVSSDVSCADKADGFIKVIIDNLPNGALVNYYWTPASLCPANNCSRVDSLSAGSFTVKVVVSYTLGNKAFTDSTTRYPVIRDLNGPCKIKIYNGISLSGENATFTIDNIEEFPEATVKIFNRWGKELFSTKSYNNKDNFWPAKGENVPTGTYFYVIDLANGTGPIKGWVEVLN